MENKQKVFNVVLSLGLIVVFVLSLVAIVGGNQGIGGATRFPNGYLDTGDGYYVDGTAIIDGDGNVDGAITSSTGTFSSTLAVTGATTLGGGTAITRVLHGTCNLVSYPTGSNPTSHAFAASSTLWHDCAVSGVTSADYVIMQIPTAGTASISLPTEGGGFIIVGARASSTSGYIGADIWNATGAATSSYTLATSSVPYWIFK